MRNLRELVFYLVSAYARYGPFSNNQWNRGQPGIYGSIEGVHDTVHGVAGGGGHMSAVPYAAFDPLFWLHHWWVGGLWRFLGEGMLIGDIATSTACLHSGKPFIPMDLIVTSRHSPPSPALLLPKLVARRQKRRRSRPSTMLLTPSGRRMEYVAH